MGLLKLVATGRTPAYYLGLKSGRILKRFLVIRTFRTHALPGAFATQSIAVAILLETSILTKDRSMNQKKPIYHNDDKFKYDVCHLPTFLTCASLPLLLFQSRLKCIDTSVHNFINCKGPSPPGTTIFCCILALIAFTD